MNAALSTADRVALARITARVAAQLPRVPDGRVRIADIMERVCFDMGVHRQDLRGPVRTPRLFRPRAAICWLARELTTSSLWTIAAAMNRDHSSVIHACRRAADMRDRDPAFRQLTDRLLAHFRNQQEN